MAAPPHPDHLPAAQQRLFERVAAAPFTLELLVPERRLLRQRCAPLHAVVADLSVTGAQLLLQPAESVLPGRVLAIRHELGGGSVRVRHVDRGGRPMRCGVEFVELDGTLRDHLHHLVAGPRAAHDWHWHHAP